MTRAYSIVQKLEKRQEILMSAEDLFVKERGEFPTVQAICLYSSIAKGTVYLYFKSKEEIYLALLEDYFKQWMDVTKVKKDITDIDQVIELILGFIQRHPYKYNLINRRHFLETHCDINKTLQFQKSLFMTFSLYAEQIALNLEAEVSKVRQWLHDIYFYMQGLWRTANPNREVKALLIQSDMEAFYLPQFEENSKRVLKRLWLDN